MGSQEDISSYCLKRLQDNSDNNNHGEGEMTQRESKRIKERKCIKTKTNE